MTATPPHKLNSVQLPIPRSDRQDDCKPNRSNASIWNSSDQKSENRSLKSHLSEESSSSFSGENVGPSSPLFSKKHAWTDNNSEEWFYQPSQTRDLQSSFRIRKHVGEGTFGSVFLALDQEGPKILKRVKTRDDKSVPAHGFPYTALREIKILQQIRHENVITLHEVVTITGSNGLPEHVFLVLEYMEYDLAAMLRLPDLACQLTGDHVQSWSRQLLQGCQHLHAQHILHRDLKPANLLLDQKGNLKIGDFGLARKLLGGDRKHTTSIGTPWYRAPEILIGSCNYDARVDIWSTGCILYELGCRHPTARPLFHASTGIDLCKQIDHKFALIQDDETWLAKEMVMARKDPVLQQDIMLAKLLSKLLQLCPKFRLSATDALKDGFFLDPGEPILNMSFPRSSGHELDVIKLEQRKHAQK